MPTLRSKPLLFLIVFAIAVIAAGCGGDDSSTTNQGPGVTTGAAQAKPEPRTAKKTEDTAKKAKQSRKGGDKQKGSDRAAADEITRKLAESGEPIPADSPVVKELLESLGKNQDGKGKRKGTDPVTKALEDVLLDPNEGGGGNRPPDGSPSAGAEKILEQLQE